VGGERRERKREEEGMEEGVMRGGEV